MGSPEADLAVGLVVRRRKSCSVTTVHWKLPRYSGRRPWYRLPFFSTKNSTRVPGIVRAQEQLDAVQAVGRRTAGRAVAGQRGCGPPPLVAEIVTRGPPTDRPRAPASVRRGGRTVAVPTSRTRTGDAPAVTSTSCRSRLRTRTAPKREAALDVAERPRPPGPARSSSDRRGPVLRSGCSQTAAGSGLLQALEDAGGEDLAAGPRRRSPAMGTSRAETASRSCAQSATASAGAGSTARPGRATRRAGSGAWARA